MIFIQISKAFSTSYYLVSGLCFGGLKNKPGFDLTTGFSFGLTETAVATPTGVPSADFLAKFCQLDTLPSRLSYLYLKKNITNLAFSSSLIN